MPSLRSSPLVANLALSAFSLVLFLAVAEGVSRVFDRPPDGRTESNYLTDWAEWDGDFYTVKSTAVGWPPWEDYNRDGLRDREHTLAKPTGVRRVACLGDSVTLGFGVKPAEAWPQRLQDLVAAEGSSLEVLNVALGGWSTRQEVLAYRRIARRYEPDLVIVGVCLNDLPELQNNLTRPPRWLASLHRRSALVRRLVRAEGREVASVEELVARPDRAVVRAAYSRFFAEVEALRRDVEADRAQLAVVLFPYRFQARQDAPAPTAQAEIAAYCRAQGLPFLDLLPALKRVGESAFLDEPHLTPLGARVAAEAILSSGLLDGVMQAQGEAVPPRATAEGSAGAGAGAPAIDEGRLLGLVRSSRAKERLDAVRGMGRTGASPAARRALRDRLGDDDPEVRAAAAWALGRLEDAEAAQGLMTLLEGPDPSGRAGAAWALGRLGENAAAARGALVRALSDSDGTVRWRAAESLGVLGASAPLLPALEAVLEVSDHPSRGAAAELIGRLGPAAAPAVTALAAALRDPREEVRGRAALAIGAVGEAAAPAVPDLVAALADETNRWKVVDALRQLGPAAAPAVPALVPLVRDPSGSVRWRAVRALGHIGPKAQEALPALREAAADPQPNVRLAAVQAMDRITKDGRETLETYESRLGDSDARVRQGAAKGLGGIGPAARSAAPVLAAALQDPDPGVRGAAARALGKMGKLPESAIAALRKALQDPVPEVRSEAEAAIRSVTGR